MRQRAIANISRVDELAASGALASVTASAPSSPTRCCSSARLIMTPKARCRRQPSGPAARCCETLSGAIAPPCVKDLIRREAVRPPPRSLGRKISDEFTVPFCRGHHREVHRCGDESRLVAKSGCLPLRLVHVGFGSALIRCPNVQKPRCVTRFCHQRRRCRRTACSLRLRTEAQRRSEPA